MKENGLPAQGDTKPSTGRPEGRRSIDSRPSDWPDYFGSNALLLLVQGWAGGGHALSHIKILQKFRFFFFTVFKICRNRKNPLFSRTEKMSPFRIRKIPPLNEPEDPPTHFKKGKFYHPRPSRPPLSDRKLRLRTWCSSSSRRVRGNREICLSSFLFTQ